MIVKEVKRRRLELDGGRYCHTIVRVAVTSTDSEGTWKTLQRYCEVVTPHEEETEGARNVDPAAHPRRRRRPQLRRSTVQYYIYNPKHAGASVGEQRLMRPKEGMNWTSLSSTNPGELGGNVSMALAVN
ncbi:unnamed protein product [Pieris macdunnoughi]|uniref:Uncharacterized protein n=1 Tax=Pieris macdunnoughi TaxID=345717 RepID=A0A821V329_9NEOP|nr:unnamed protein product [Pieris macdunnoughi]